MVGRHDVGWIVVVAQAACRIPGAWPAGLLAALGAALFGGSALLLKTGTVSWDLSLFRVLNQVPAAVASVLTPLSRLFLPAGIIVVVVLIVLYALARNRSVLPVATAAMAAGVAWLLADVAKAIADRPRPYEVMADAVLRQQPAHGTSFPSTHTAVTLAVAIALVPFLARPLALTGIGYAVLVGLVPDVPGSALSPGHPGRSRYRHDFRRRDHAGPRDAVPRRGPGRERPGCHPAGPGAQGRPEPRRGP